jgi:hypothetical protein
MSAPQAPLSEIVFARGYTLRLLDAVSPDDWFKMSHEGVTHIAWQVGHLAFAEYRLALLRVRGARPEDSALLPTEFLRLFGAESAPDPDAGKYPRPPEIRAVLDRVHEQVLRDVPAVPDADLEAPIEPPHPIAKTKREALKWCAAHEMVHAGQIGLLRRLIGHRPLW